MPAHAPRKGQMGDIMARSNYPSVLEVYTIVFFRQNIVTRPEHQVRLI